MKLSSCFSFALLFPCFLITATASSNQASHLTGDVSIDCGSTRNHADAAGSKREWVGDVSPSSSSWLHFNGFSTASSAALSARPTPHQKARLSRSKFSYTVHVDEGQKIIRLHFNPTSYRGFKGFKDLFTVESGPFILLSNFSASLTAAALGVNTFVKEFCIKTEHQHLNLVFSAESSQSLDTYAFINGIEIISVSTSLPYFSTRDTGVQVVGQKSLVHVDNSVALEIVHRTSIKHDFVSSPDDSGDMFDNNKNITWKIPVDVGFRYLVRLHLSEMRFKMAESVGMKFKVLINELVAGTIIRRDESSIPWYEDYVVMMNGCKQEGKRNLLICLKSNQDFMDTHGPLKGFEILKLSNNDNSLAAPNPPPPSQTAQTPFMVLGRRNTVVTIAITVVSLVNIIVHELRERQEARSSEEENKPSPEAEKVCRQFSLAEIQLATKNFNGGLVIGKGGSARVYKGLIDKGQKTVAIKKLRPNSKQGSRQFLTEIETLAEMRHTNVLSLIGYCNDRREMIIVYEFMASGSLADHLYKLPRDNSNCSSLTWLQRLHICIGVARGIEYLHTGRGIIHRDIKSSNILLDKDFVAKVSDFGLAKPEDRNKLKTHVSTNAKGTYGYADPCYVNTNKLRRKSDTYSFGVVLLEVLCGRRAVDSDVAEDERILTNWARDKISKGEVDEIIASSLREEISPYSLKTFLEIAKRCLNDEPENRPTMSEVVSQLEYALKQQETKRDLVLNEIESEIRDAGIDLPRAAQPIETTTNIRNFTLPLDRPQTSGRVVKTEPTSVRRQWTKFTTIKLSRFRPWLALRKRFNRSQKKEYQNLESAESLQYDFATIAAATNYFSDRLGQGGFGSVYKGILMNGQEIAVKRLSSGSRQGNREFRSELMLLARILHRNLVRLLGFCLEGNEMLLIYEFVENSSLDRFIFDPVKRSCLDWNQWYRIIQGTAMGLMYLHDGCEFRIIHRDLKASNVLLDGNFNPKISDFGLARELSEDETRGETSRVVGTFGYMAPEYAISGLFSAKSDVFSFGVLVLEILSGQRNSGAHKGVTGERLISLAWKNWCEGTAEKVIDPLLRRAGSDSVQGMMRCMHVGLLCIQENPSSRPAMVSVTRMLDINTATLPTPSEPVSFGASPDMPEVLVPLAYRTNHGTDEAPASPSRNDLSVSDLSAR